MLRQKWHKARHVGVEPDAIGELELLNTRAQRLVRDVRLVISEADVVDTQEAQHVHHSGALI